MIRGLVHRCTVWTPAGQATDAYGQPAPTSFATAATDVPCRLSLIDADRPLALLRAEQSLGPGDRLTDVKTPAGQSVDPGPFAVLSIERLVGRAGVAFQRCQLQRLISLDQT